VVDRFITITRETNEEHLQAFHLGLEDGTINSEVSLEIAYSQLEISQRAITHQAIVTLAKLPENNYTPEFQNSYFRYFLDFFIRGIAAKPNKIEKFNLPAEEEKE
jgi:hypothetical protein